MTSAPAANHFHNSDAALDDQPAVPRVRFRPGPPNGNVDGAWWPRSRDLATELPTLLGAIADIVGTAAEISYHPGDWSPALLDLTRDERLKVVDFDSPLRCTIQVRGSRSDRTILIVPPQTSEMLAADILAAVLAHGHRTRVPALLRPHSPTPPEGDLAPVDNSPGRHPPCLVDPH